MPMFQSPISYIFFLKIIFLWILMMTVILLSSSTLILIFLLDILTRADAPVMGTLWEFIIAADFENG